LAELNQELFDKLFGAGTIATLDELKAKLKKMLKRNLQLKQIIR
jgi:FKBP-type peptidyl-prolyl cis-trans isomerase (trigger factor)